MYKFSKQSLDNLSQCDVKLQRICKTIILFEDIAIITGYRNMKEQNEKFAQGLSKLKYPYGKHNVRPSKAVDIAPYPIDWNDIERFKQLSKLFKAIAYSYDIAIRWGGEWDDWGHYELRS